MDATRNIGIGLVEGVKEGMVGVVGLADRLGESGFGLRTHTLGNGLGSGNRLLSLSLNGGLEEAVLDELLEKLAMGSG